MRFDKEKQRSFSNEQYRDGAVTRSQELEQKNRDALAQAWRGARKTFWGQPPNVRAAITREWLSWRGPAKCPYFLLTMENVILSMNRASPASPGRALVTM